MFLVLYFEILISKHTISIWAIGYAIVAKGIVAKGIVAKGNKLHTRCGVIENSVADTDDTLSRRWSYFSNLVNDVFRQSLSS